MVRYGQVATALCLLHAALAVKVKVVLHSEEDSRHDDDVDTENWDTKVTMLPFISRARVTTEPEEEHPTSDKPSKLHPNDLVFPLIYHQSHINGMFKYGANWYTWSTDKRPDGSSAVNYYICYDEPKRCDDVGWERTDSVPKCAFQIDSVLADDRACINPFGVEPRASSDARSSVPCDGAEQMKVSDISRACGARIRSLWRFVRVGRRPPSAAKPADVNSLVCDDEEECYITIEYRIHHDRITFSLHEPTRGQTFKSVLKRVTNVEEEKTTEHHPHIRERSKKRDDDDERKFHIRLKAKPTAAEGKGMFKEQRDRRQRHNKINVREDVSEDTSE